MLDKSTLPQSVNEVEVLDAVRALLFAKDIDVSSIILEGDYEVIIKALIWDDVSFGHIKDKAIFLSNFFVDVVFPRTKRQGSLVAHDLIRHVSSFLVQMKNVHSHF